MGPYSWGSSFFSIESGVYSNMGVSAMLQQAEQAEQATAGFIAAES